MAILNDYLVQLAEIKKLPKGWGYGQGDEFSEKTLTKALYYLSELEEIGVDIEVEIMPNSDDTLTIICTKHLTDEFIDIIIDHNITPSIRHEKGIGRDYKTLMEETPATLEEIKQKLNETFS